jgi:hypothetical protein
MPDLQNVKSSKKAIARISSKFTLSRHFHPLRVCFIGKVEKVILISRKLNLFKVTL